MLKTYFAVSPVSILRTSTLMLVIHLNLWNYYFTLAHLLYVLLLFIDHHYHLRMALHKPNSSTNSPIYWNSLYLLVNFSWMLT